MKKRRFLTKTVQVCTGKYGLLLLTALNVCLACLIVMLSGFRYAIDMAHRSTDFMTYFLLDFRAGFVSRTLIGSILYLFTKHPTVPMVTNILLAVTSFSLILFSFFQAQIVKTTLLKSDHATLLLSTLFFVNKIFWLNSVEMFGLLDIFLTILLQLYVLCLERNRTIGYWIAPIVCVVGLLIHTSYVFVVFPVMAALCWYDLLTSGKRSGIRRALFVLTCIVSVVLFLLFTLFPQKLVLVDPDELNAMIREKYSGHILEDYHFSYLFRTNAAKSTDTMNVFDYLNAAGHTNFFTFYMLLHIMNILALTVPLYFGCVHHARRTGSRLIAYLGFAAPLAAMFCATSFTTDKTRFLSLGVVEEYMLMHYLVTQTDVCFLPCVSEPPPAKLSNYAVRMREEKMKRTLLLCTILGLLFTLCGYFIL